MTRINQMINRLMTETEICKHTTCFCHSLQTAAAATQLFQSNSRLGIVYKSELLQADFFLDRMPFHCPANSINALKE